jgi:hypothetical protein
MGSGHGNIVSPVFSGDLSQFVGKYIESATLTIREGENWDYNGFVMVYRLTSAASTTWDEIHEDGVMGTSSGAVLKNSDDSSWTVDMRPLLREIAAGEENHGFFVGIDNLAHSWDGVRLTLEVSIDESRIDCSSKCLENGYPTCSNIELSSNQKLSCAQGCDIAQKGSSLTECVNLCQRDSKSGCNLRVNDFAYHLCGDMCGGGNPTVAQCEFGCQLVHGTTTTTTTTTTTITTTTTEPTTTQTAQVFDFELRGRIGDEVVIITRGEDKHTETLSTDYKAFSATNENIVITFKNDVGPPEQDVYFKSSVHTNIRSDGLFFTMELWDIK